MMTGLSGLQWCVFPSQRIGKPTIVCCRNAPISKADWTTCARNSHSLVAQWIASRNHAPRPVDTTAFMLRLRLDEGSGEILRNSAPNANPATFRTTILQAEWGETTWLWPDFRMQSSTRVLLGQSGDYENQSGLHIGWLVSLFRSAPFQPRELWHSHLQNGFHAARSRLGTFDR